ncbi:Hypothetical protein CINCED_3A002740 [Cinara cedri]|uniref:Uncharacterized protein n=1 Tax=Cinara cedri TaxID=506608 RepID=A0A5E4ME64_9HEMI|nr:Hypothetical protein CINCED_3A002740 [Cinara cedri]
MTASKDELEIVATNYNPEDPAEQLLLIRYADEKAENIAKNIVKLKTDLHNLQNNCKNTVENDSEISKLKEKLKELIEEYKTAINEVLELAKSINFDVEDLEYRKVDIDLPDKISGNNVAGGETDRKSTFDDCDEDLFDPLVIIDDHCTKKPKIFFIGDDSKNGNKACEDEYGSICSCTDESSECLENCCADNVNKASNHQLCKSSGTGETDYQKEAIRDDLMILKGRMKLLHQQNSDLLSSLNSSNQRTQALSDVLQKKPAFMKCKMDDAAGHSANVDKKTETNMMAEIKRLRDELKEMKRDQCQIALARKILNVADSQCVNCVGTIQGDDNKTQLNSLREDYNELMADRDAKVNQIANLLKMLDEAKYKYRSFEDSLIVSKAQVVQLEKQLFDLTSAKTNDSALACSNNNYLLESLKHRLEVAKREKCEFQMVLDFHLTELEDKKTKYLEELQNNHKLKCRVETLLKEKNTISQEYEAEFNRMNPYFLYPLLFKELLMTRLKEFESLPGMLASTQRDLKKERFARTALEDEREEFLNEISALKICLETVQGNTPEKDNTSTINDLKEQNTQLKAQVNILEDTIEENNRLYMERTHYSLQLKDYLDVAREEAAMQVTKIKDFSECQKKNYGEYIQELEQKLAESRAMACCEFQKREEVDTRLRNRIEILTNNLKEAQNKIGELIKMREILESPSDNNKWCSMPVMLQSTCADLNKPKIADMIQ